MKLQFQILLFPAMSTFHTDIEVVAALKTTEAIHKTRCEDHYILRSSKRLTAFLIQYKNIIFHIIQRNLLA
jgi:hypothetical protein